MYDATGFARTFALVSRPSRELEAKVLEAKELKQAATSSSVSTAPSFISNSELADQSNCSSMLGTINGERVEGTRWLNMPRVSEPKNLVAFGGCPISGPPSTRPIRRTSTWGGATRRAVPVSGLPASSRSSSTWTGTFRIGGLLRPSALQ